MSVFSSERLNGVSTDQINWIISYSHLALHTVRVILVTPVAGL